MPVRPAAIAPAKFPTPRTGLEKLQANLNLARSRPVDLLFDGDSITEFWATRGQGVWQQRYGQLNAMDYGLDADRTQNVLWRLNHGELDGLHPKLIVLMVGIENLDNGILPHPLVKTNTPEETAAGVRLLIDAYRKKCPAAHILLMGALPRILHPFDWTGMYALTASIKQFNQLISKFDDGKTVTFLDIGSKFLNQYGLINDDFMPDELHPSPKGYQIWADAIQPIVDRYCPAGEKTSVANFQPVVGSALSLSWPFSTDPPPGMSPAVFPIPAVGWGLAKFADNVRKLKNGPYDLVFDGDSITDNWQLRPAWRRRPRPK